MSLADVVLPRIAAVWRDEIVPSLSEYIRIPCVSSAYEPKWAELGHMDRAVEHIRDWCAAREVQGLTIERHDLPGRSPVLLMEIPAFNGGRDDRTILFYGHLDKQPEMEGWFPEHGPWDPHVTDGKLYGRGGGDDGYAAYVAIAALEALQAAGGRHDRAVVLIEASEESGSIDLPAHLVALADRIGTPDLVMCLDGGCLDYGRLWVTSSLRGLVGLTLTVEVLEEGVHSGEASGVVPSSFRIARQLLDRIEDAATGRLLLEECHVEVPADRLRQATAVGREFPDEAGGVWRFAGTTEPMSADPVEQLLARTWRPTLSYTGADGLPPTGRAGNVLRPSTSLRLSFRLPPTCDSAAALAAISERLLADPPSGARVSISHTEQADGWNAPEFAPWLDAALDAASGAAWGAPARAYGEGGSIPFMGLLGEQFPAAQIIVTGVLGPGSNAHGPNEFVDLLTAERVTGALALVLDTHSRTS